MKRIIASLTFLCVYHASAQQKDTITASSVLTNATVYYGYGAELQHNAKASLISGLQQVVINDIALQPDINTIQIGCPEQVTILSYYHRIYTPTANAVSGVSTKADDSIKLLAKKLAAVDNDYNIYENILVRLTGLIENNFATSTKKEISSDDLIKLTIYYTDKVKDIKLRLFELKTEMAEINNKINEIQSRRNIALNTGNSGDQAKSKGQLILQVMNGSSGSASFDITYFTRNAGWIPAYDIRVKTMDNTLKLVYKASVTQSTGLDWKGIKLNLSTSNPNQGTTIPSLVTTYLQLYVPVLYNSITAESNTTLSDVVITGLNKGKSKETADKVSDYMNLKESQLNINFEIDLPYDIPSDGKAYSINIKDEKIPATYKHYAIPKLDNDAFLVAELSRWDSLGLLPGEANIIMDNVYLGKSMIDPNTTTDTLNLSLGRDKRVALKRLLIKEYTTSAIKGETKTELYTYEITVKNNKKQPLSILVRDQYPISKQKEVEVVLIKDGSAEVNKETGILTWNIKLQPGESRKFRFSYSVKYPKDKILQDMR